MLTAIFSPWRWTKGASRRKT